jgi:MFS family permease
MHFLRTFLSLPPNLDIDPQVRRHFKRNYITNMLDGAFWLLAESFVSVNTILPVFASTLTDSAILIGLVPALIQAGWYLPQIFLAGYVHRLKRKRPFAVAMAVVERVPYLFLPLTAFLLHWLPKETAVWVFMVAVAFRGFASGIVALPWQVLIAKVIPAPVRSRFFGIGRTIGRTMAMAGSALSGLILAEVAYPDNFGVSFLIGMVFMWVSFFFFSRTVEPEPAEELEEAVPAAESAEKRVRTPLLDLPAFKRIWREDHNFRRYVVSRIFFQLGSMAAGFFAVYGVQHFNLPDQQAALFSGLLFGGGMAGFLVWGVVGDRFGGRNILLVSDLMQSVVLVLALISPSVWTYNLIFLIFGFAQSGYMVGEMLIGMSLGPESERSLYLGLMRTIPGFFVLIAPLIGGAIVEAVSYPVMFVAALGLGLVGVGLLASVKTHPA